jgi:hypothetical protein
MSSVSDVMLVAGFRLMADIGQVSADQSVSVVDCDVAPENSPSSVRKWLVDCERFGVVPHFNRHRANEIGGWDEGFMGWGGEDQDMIERYLAAGSNLILCPDLVYIHLKHAPDPEWSERQFVDSNRNHYYASRSKRRGT